jgi:hypothetical protein
MVKRISITYKGEEKAFVNDKGFVEFIGTDLNELIDDQIGSVQQVEDEYGNVILEKGIPPLEHKLLFMQEELGFEVLVDGKSSVKAVKEDDSIGDYFKRVKKDLLGNTEEDS